MSSKSEVMRSAITSLKWIMDGVEDGKIDVVGLNFKHTNMSDYVDGSVTVKYPQHTTVIFEIVQNRGER